MSVLEEMIFGHTEIKDGESYLQFRKRQEDEQKYKEGFTSQNNSYLPSNKDIEELLSCKKNKKGKYECHGYIQKHLFDEYEELKNLETKFLKILNQYENRFKYEMGVINKKLSFEKKYTTNCELKYGDKIVIAYTSYTDNTSNCGYYGCRVAQVNSDRYMAFNHGGSEPTVFYLRPPVNSDTYKQGDVIKFGDPVVIAYTSQSGNTSNCGYYGCRVAQLNNNAMYFGHGQTNPTVFYLKPEVGSSKNIGDSIMFGDKCSITHTNVTKNSCGYYGCHVGKIDSSVIGGQMTFSSGNSEPQTFYMRIPVDERNNKKICYSKDNNKTINLEKIVEKVKEDKELKKYSNKLTSILKEIESKIKKISKEDNKLQKLLFSEYNQLAGKITSYDIIEYNIKEENKSLIQANAMLDDSDIQLINSNYKYILFSILAVGLTIASMRAMKN